MENQRHIQEKNIWHHCFSETDGRIPRSTFWKGAALLTGIHALLFLISIIGLGAVAGSFEAGVLLLLVGTFVLLILWIMLDIKRLHDINLSGWWMFIVLVPYLGILAIVILVGFVKGTAGTNRFGHPDTGKKGIRTETTPNR